MTKEDAKAIGILASVAAYEIEIKNIRHFLREKRTVSEWQDWLWRRVSKLTGQTTKLRPSTRILGRWGPDNACVDKNVLYTDLLTCLCAGGVVERVSLGHTTTYKWVGK